MFVLFVLAGAWLGVVLKLAAVIANPTTRPLGRRVVNAHAIVEMARNTPATGLASVHTNASTNAGIVRRRLSATAAASPRAIPNPNVRRPTATLVTVAPANHRVPTVAAAPNTGRTRRVKHAAATAAGGGSVSAVGGQAVPAVVAFLSGYRAGVKDTDPSMSVQQGYSQDFVDQAKCKELALTQIARASKAVFAAAGGCGLGALQAAKERKVWGIGVDNDQSFLGPHILTSATKKVDVAVFDAIEAVTKDSFEGGGDTPYDVANGGVGYGKVSAEAPDRDALIAKLDDVSEQIASGDVDIPRR